MVCVDLMDSFTIRTPSKTHSLLALTMIDPVINTDWFEIVKDTTKSETSIQDFFHKTFLEERKISRVLSETSFTVSTSKFKLM
jgi:hypothetical protein